MDSYTGTHSSPPRISKGYRRWIGRLKTLDLLPSVFTLMVAPLTSPSAPVTKLSTRANFQKPLGRSSPCTTTMSPTATGVGTVSLVEKMTVGTILMKMAVLLRLADKMNSAAMIEDASHKHGSVIKMRIVKMDPMSLIVIEI